MVDGPDRDDLDEIRLVLPAMARYARIARLTVTGLAARMGFSYDEVEDLRIAIGELCSILFDDPHGRVAFTCSLSSDSLTVVAERDPAGPLPPITDLSVQILDAVVDRTRVDAGRGLISVTKQRRP